MWRSWIPLLLSLPVCTWTIATTDNGCPVDWTHDNGECYGVVYANQVLTSVYDARQLCRSYGADLVDVTSKQIETILMSLISSQPGSSESVYIGLNDITAEGEFVYADSSNVNSYTKWAAGQPDVSNTGNATNCVMLNVQTAKWTNVGCCQSQGISFVTCQKPNDSNVTTVGTDNDVFAKTCFQGVNECDSSPCLNGATCQDHVLYFECDCAAGYNGTRCQYDACTPSPCQHNRPCSLSGPSYTCACGDWYNGTNCENIASQCSQQLCQNNATCTGDHTSYQCSCLPGFMGTHCETNINECVNVTCVHGTCIDEINSASCRCDSGYGGSTCNQVISCSSLTIANATSLNTTNAAPYNSNDMLFFSCLDGLKFPDMEVNKTTTCTGQGWTPALPPCGLHCDTIPSVSHSSVMNGNTLVGTTVNFTCDIGYQFPDNSTVLSIECLSPGDWSNLNVPNCQVVKCPELPTFPYQELDSRNNTYNALITFWCDIGYELHDHTTARTIKCLSTGEWTADLPPCQPVKCPEIDMATIPGNTRNSSAVEYDSYVEYVCESGKRMVDGSTYRVLRCDAMAEWSDNITDCDTNRCFPLPYVAKSTPSALDAIFGSVVTLTCITGHRFFIGSQKYASRSMTCSGSNGRWSPILAACEPIVCSNLTIPAKASLSTANRLFATVVNVTCDIGHYYNVNTMEKVRWSRCEENGQWDMVTTDPCIAIPCPNAPGIFNGSRTGGASGYVYADQVQYDCDDGFKFVDGRLSKSISCTELGDWDDTDMSCRKDRCDPVPVAANTEPNTRNTSWSTEVVYTCKPGYYWTEARFPGGKTEHRITCNLGTWTDTNIPYCDPKVCPVIMKMDNATLNATDAKPDRLYNTVVEYSCDTGFKYADNETLKYRRCDESGQWAPKDALFPVCEIIVCPELEEVSNATRDSNTTVYGSTVNYVCDQGYQYPTKELSLPIQCTENATWTAYPPPCEVVFCPPLPLWNEAYFNDTSNEFDAVVNYSCKAEFIFEDFTYNAANVKVADDEKLSMCMTDKTWQPPIVNCREIVGIADDLIGVVYESPNSVSIGTLAITLLSLVGALLLCLDANKLYGDVKVMKSNVAFCVEKRRSRISNSTANIQCEEVSESTA